LSQRCDTLTPAAGPAAGGRPPTYDDLPCLPYLEAVVKEVLRLYPAIPVFPRQAAQADVLPSGHAIRQGAHPEGGELEA
jgi:cytochrome P450